MALWLLLPAAVLGFVVLVLFSYTFARVPLPEEIRTGATVLLDQAGREIGELTAQASRQDVPLATLPPHVRNSVLAAEDAGFYDHPGVSVPGIVRAAFKNLLSRGVSQGGSTISQQYIKNVTDQRQQTALRKIREAALAMKLERQYSKDQILEFYLNTIYYGRGAYGIQAAAQAYFGKGAADLSVAEAAQLAGIIPAPSALDPLKNPEGAHKRYRYVLERMVANEWLPSGEAARLAASPPQAMQARAIQFRTAPFFVELVQRELARRLGEDMVYAGLRVTTTLDLGIQNVAQARFDEAIAEAPDEEATAAMVSLDPATGGIRALVNGRPGEQINFVADSRRQPGSTFKPFTLAAWVEEGNSPESGFAGPSEMTFPNPGGEPHTVRNYGGQGYGRITLREATWKSVNTIYTQLIDQVGPKAVVDIAKRAGVESDLEPNLSLTLGTNGVTPLELATGFNTFATGGVRRMPFTVLKVERDGQTLFQARPSEDRGFSEQVAWTVTDVLTGVIERGTGRAADIGRPAAGKTGTTQNSADAWFAGYTPHLTTVVWYGQRDGNAGLPSGPTGGGWPARLWGAYMREALQGVPPDDFPEPEGDLKVVGPTEEPEPTETAEPDALECPEGQVPVTAEGQEGGESDGLQQVCAPTDTASPSPSASPSPTATPTTASPSPTDSPLPTETTEPTAQPEPTQTSAQTSADSGPSPSPSG